jgi:hypothetical protein
MWVTKRTNVTFGMAAKTVAAAGESTVFHSDLHATLTLSIKCYVHWLVTAVGMLPK